MIWGQPRGLLEKSLLAHLEDGGVFYSEAYCRYLESIGESPIYVYDQDFIMLVVIKKRKWFRYASLPVEYLNHSRSANSDPRMFLDNCFAYLGHKLKLHWVNAPETTARFQEMPAKCIWVPYGNNIIDLTRDEREIWSDFDKNNRNRIRKAESSDVECVGGGRELLKDFHMLYAKTNGANALDIAYFERLFDFMGDYIKLHVAYCNGHPQVSNMVYRDSHMCYEMHAGSAEGLTPGVGNLLQWTIIKDMKAEGVRLHSLVGARVNPDPDSKYHGINRFKLRFAPHIEPCYLFKVIFDVRMYRLSSELKGIIGRLKRTAYVGDIIDQEIRKWIDLNELEQIREIYGNRFMNSTEVSHTMVSAKK